MANVYINSSGTWQKTWGGGYSTSACYCSSGCYSGCSGGCTYGCNNECTGSTGTCGNSCAYECYAECRGTCGSYCAGGCSGGCENTNNFRTSSSTGTLYGTTTTYVQLANIKSNSNGTFKVPNNLRLNVSNTWKTISK